MASWTEEQNKRFEQLLAVYGEGTPNRWQNVAHGVDKSVEDVKRQYKRLEDDVRLIESVDPLPTPSPPTASGWRSRGGGI